jgi:hypothetical protein
MPGLPSLSHRLALEKDFDAVYDLYMDENSNRFLTYDPVEKEEFETVYKELHGTNTLYLVEFGMKSSPPTDLFAKQIENLVQFISEVS